MNFYEVSLLKSPLNALTYQSKEEIKIGALVRVKLRGRKNLSDAVVIKKVEKPEFKCVDIDEISEFFYDDMMFDVSKFISSYYISSLGEALSIYTPSYLIEKDDIKDEFNSEINLSKKQNEALNFLNEKKQALLFANTGSGKTEIYIKIIEKHLNENKQAVLLMPEISLTPQMQKRLEKVFGSSVAIWHSKITKKKKETITQNLLKGEVKLIAGARSALFLPYSDLGVIIVDEEHDESYKSDSKPRLNAKDLSIYIGKKYGVQVVLGSATPSLSSFDKLPYFRLKETFFESNKNIYFDDNSDTGLSENIKHKIAQTLNQNKQVIIFLPTRANFKYQVCDTCGKAVECPYCSVSMSLHKNSLALKCHYCNYAQRIPDVCPSCNTGVIRNIRIGTAQVEEELNELFPQKIIKRFDRDSITTDNKLRKTLKEFNDEKIDILVGTQMLSKGHDYHNVTLAVVLGIDSILNMNSYKARERSLSLLIQIAGRSGRKGFGEVIVQTKNNDFFEYFLTSGDYEEFLREELLVRKGLYPPSVKMAKIIFAHANGIKVQEELNKYVHILKQCQGIEVVGFGECVILKVANKYRYEIILRSASVKALLNALYCVNSPMAIIDMDTIH